MGLESATYVNQLNAANPVGAVDPKSQGDDHLRLVKNTLLASFPNIGGAMTATHTQLNGIITPTVPANKVKGSVAAAAGSAVTLLHSDVQLILDLADSYAWTGTHSWTAGTAGITINSTTVGAAAYSFFQLAGVTKVRVGVEGTAGGAITGSSVGDALIWSVTGVSFSGNSGGFGMRFNGTSAALELGTGTAALPSYSFNVDPDTGFYRVAANNLRISAGNLDICGFANAAGTPIIQPFGVLQAIIDGTVGTPLYSFNNDPDTGIYRNGANSLAIAANGAISFATDNVATYFKDGAVGTPGFTWINDPDTGLFRVTANQVNLARGGADWGAVVGAQMVAKGAATSRNTTTTLTDDPHLVVTLPAGTYDVELWVPTWATTTGTQGIKFALAFTGTAAASLFSHQSVLNGGSVTNQAQPFGTAFSSANIVLTSAATDFIYMRGVAIVTVAGNLSFQWAQNSSSANNTNVGAGGFVRCTRMA